jgi:uncharacterized protein
VARPLVVPIADLRRHPGSRRHLTVPVEMGDLAISTAVVPAGAELVVDLELEALSAGLTATGTITVPWEGECRRCLTPVRGESVAEVKEVFEPRPVEGETYPLGDDLVDLEPMVRDAALLALPLAPLCGPECRGPAPDDFPALPEDEVDPAEAGPSGTAAQPGDPRWAALDALRFDSPGGGG